MIVERISLIVVPVLVGSLIAGIPALPGMVVCFGEDGHVAIELGIDDCCPSSQNTEPASRSSAAQPLASDGASDCGDCEDVSVDQIIGDTLVPSFMPVADAAPILSAVAEVWPSATARESSNRILPRGDQTQRMRAATILLI